MSGVRQIITGGVVVALISLGAALLSARPTVQVLPADSAVVKISFTHGGQRRCRERSAAELAKLARNMRRRKVCDRQRQPIYLELEIDRHTVFARSLPPSGIAGDGASRVYRRFTVPAGRHDVAVRLRETPDGTAFDYSAERTVTLAPTQNFVIDFRAEAGGFVFK